MNIQINKFSVISLSMQLDRIDCQLTTSVFPHLGHCGLVLIKQFFSIISAKCGSITSAELMWHLLIESKMASSLSIFRTSFTVLFVTVFLNHQYFARCGGLAGQEEHHDDVADWDEGVFSEFWSNMFGEG